MIDKYGAGQDPYTYEGTGVLINTFDIRDEFILEQAEKDLVAVAAASIHFQSPPYDVSYLRQLHKSLFGVLYAWAGEFRTIDISKGQTRFCHAARIEKEAEKIFKQLGLDNYLQNLPYDAFVSKLACYYCEINVIHPFR
jgi:cell filamentation protein